MPARYQARKTKAIAKGAPLLGRRFGLVYRTNGSVCSASLLPRLVVWWFGGSVVRWFAIEYGEQIARFGFVSMLCSTRWFDAREGSLICLFGSE